ncbi:hypothetical protein ABZ208_12610 [Streptomyces sp. NPDC006208]|uniref:hypothetical protein n=1 Tax=Streptomyces sp. NPDC006208 TaxID=3156734 RepID=UPI0033B5EB44
MHKVLRTVGCTAAAVAGVLLTAGPAAAANWSPVQTSSRWHCTRTDEHAYVRQVSFQACYIALPQTKKQVVLVVRNDGPGPVSIQGIIDNIDGSETLCAQSTLNAGFTRGCFGHFTPTTCNRGVGYATLIVNGRSDSMPTPRVRDCDDS